MDTVCRITRETAGAHIFRITTIFRLFLSSVNYQTTSGFDEAGRRPTALDQEDIESDHALFQLLTLSPPSGAHELWLCFNPWWPQPEGPCARQTNQLLHPDQQRPLRGSLTISHDETAFAGQIAKFGTWWTALITLWGWRGLPSSSFQGWNCAVKVTRIHFWLREMHIPATSD